MREIASTWVKAGIRPSRCKSMPCYLARFDLTPRTGRSIPGIGVTRDEAKRKRVSPGRGRASFSRLEHAKTSRRVSFLR